MTATAATEPTAGEPRQDRYRVTGGCLDCAGDLEGLLGPVPGVERVDVLGAAGVVVVTHNGGVPASDITDRAARLGIELEPATTTPPPGAVTSRAWWRNPQWFLLAAATLLLLVGLAIDHLTGLQAAATSLYLATVALGGIYPVRSAMRVLAQRRLSIGTLLVAGTIGALALGVIEEAALLVVVFSLGEVLEDYVADKSRSSIRALMALTPPTARRLGPDSASEDVPVEALAPGDRVLVRPGERLPTDGRVVAGRSWVDQSAITGESLPIETGPGTDVFGGTVNTTGALTVQVTKPFADTVLARIIDQVERARSQRGTAQRFADRFAAVYTPAMFGLAVLVATLGPLTGLSLRDAIYRGLVVLTVSCSCALVISVPVAVVAAISRSARDGVLIKGGAHLETLARIDTIAFDKTGTLTQGQPAVTDVLAIDGHQPDRLLALAAGVEATSEHPLGSAVTAAAQRRGLAIPAAHDTHAVPGSGIRGQINRQHVYIGRPHPGLSIPAEVEQELARLEQAGNTTAVVALDDRAAGILAIADQLRSDATATVAELHTFGLNRLVLLTGDNPRTAHAIASAVGINDYQASLLPEDKAAEITRLRQHGHVVAMVGDGINDAPALATADVGIAMGAAGSDIALETADVALMADELTKLPAALALARRARRVITGNVAMSLATVALLVTGALAGRLSLAAGLLLNEGTALLIIANGLRLLRRTPAAPTSSLEPNPRTAA